MLFSQCYFHKMKEASFQKMDAKINYRKCLKKKTTTTTTGVYVLLNNLSLVIQNL